MDDVPRDSQAQSPSASFGMGQAASPDRDGPGQDQDGEAADDPYSPGPEALPLLLGSLIALITVVVPLAMVVTGRSLSNPPQSVDRSAPSAGLHGAWAGEPAGDNPRRQPP